MDCEELNENENSTLLQGESFEPKEKAKNIHLGIELKEGYGMSQLMAILLVFGYATSVGLYFDIQLIFLLKDPAYFNVSQDSIGREINQLIFYTILANMVSFFFSGYLHDLLGRRRVLITSLVIVSALVSYMPRAAPVIYPDLLVCRMGAYALSNTALMTPLIADYVKKKDRGKATALQGVGFLISNLFSLQVLFYFTKDLKYETAFGVVSLFYLGVGVVLWFIVMEPIEKPKKKKKNDGENENDSISLENISMHSEGRSVHVELVKQRVFAMSSLFISEFRRNTALPICFAGVIIITVVYIVNNTFLLLWLTSFVDEGVLRSDDEAKILIQYYNLISISVIILLFVFIFKTIDKFKSWKTISFLFTARCMIIFFAFLRITTPNSAYGYIVNCLMIIFTLAQRSYVDALFNKNINQKIKGVMAGLYFFTGCIGALVYSQIGGVLYTNYGAHMPFVAVGMYDGLLVLFILGMVAAKKFDQ